MALQIRQGYDVVVVGGGTAGAIAGIAAARSGAKTLLVEKFGSLGGIVTLGMSFKGVHDGEGYKALGGIGEELIERARQMNGATIVSDHPRHGSIMGQDPEAMKMTLIEMVKESGLHLLLHSFLIDAVVEDNQIQSITVANKSGLESIPAKCFVDCTGDADLVARAGGEFLYGREGDGFVQPVSSIFRVGGLNLDKTWAYLSEHPEEGEAPEDYQGDEYSADKFRSKPGVGVEGFRNLIRKAREAGDFHISRDKFGFNPFPGRNEATINITRVHEIDGTNPDDLTRAEIETQLQMLESVRFFRKYVPGFENCYVVSSPFQVGIRETRHILGSYIMTKEDVMEGRDFADQIGRGAYPLDIHDVNQATKVLGKKVQGGGVTLWKINRSYGIPARCLIPKGIKNLTVAGRSVSATHEAAGSLRGQPVCMATGHAAGTMAALAAQSNRDVSQLSIVQIQTLLISQNAVIQRK